MEEGLSNMQLSTENVDKSKSDTLAEMTEQEMSQHLSLCLKLAAENKINTKNAFGLHLIRIMRHRVTQNSSDLQFASLSLQASSKIYAGRVENLYKDTFAFHNHLQTIVANKKVTGDKEQADDAECSDDGEDRREKRRAHKSKQTYLTTEENVAFKSETTYTNSNPHANFITIKSAFTASRTAPKLLEGLILENDSSRLCCTTPAPCFNPQKPTPVCQFSCPGKRKILLNKVQNVRLNCTGYETAFSSSNVFFTSPRGSPPPAAQELDLNDDSFFIGGATPVRLEQDGDVQEIIEKFSVLDITADLFANDLSLAIVNDNTVDRRLLPPNSALKRVLNTAEKLKVTKTPLEKTRKEKPPKEPFFNKVVDKSILKKGRKIVLTENEIVEWETKNTTGENDKFSTLLTDHYDMSNCDTEEIMNVTYKLIQDKTQGSNFNGYFCKKFQLWNRFGHPTNTCLLRPSSLGVCLRNDSDSGDLSISSEANSNCILQPFQNLSIHNSQGASDDEDLFMPPDGDDFVPEISSPTTAEATHTRLNSGFFEDDLKSVMVTPPELVQPLNMKFQTEPITLNTEKVKDAIWDCVEKADEILLSDMHKKLEAVFEKEKLPLQYVFAMLLLLANEKCLLLENISNGADLKIMKDVSELDEVC